MDFDTILKQATEIKPEEYFGHLQQLLHVEEDLPLFIGHAKNEEEIRKDPSVRVVCSISMPPPMQALRVEEGLLADQIRRVVRGGGTGSEEHKDLISNRLTVEGLIMNWVDEELIKRPDVMQIIGKKQQTRLIGKHWRMLIIIEK